jgi:hypothetical protein
MRRSVIAAATAVLVSFGAMACGSTSDSAKAPPPPEAAKPPEPQIPAGPVPVTLPAIPAASARKVAAADAFVTIDADGMVRAGKLAPGPTPYAGEPAPTDRTLEAFVFPLALADDPPPPEEEEPPPPEEPDVVDPDEESRGTGTRQAGILGSAELTQGGSFASLTGTGDISDSGLLGALSSELQVVGVRESISVVDVVVLADARGPFHLTADRIVELGEHRIVLGVQGTTAPEAAQYRFGGRRIGTAEPATVLQFDGDAAAPTLTATGKRGVTTLAATGAGFTPAAIAAAVKREPLDPDLGAVAVRCTETTTVDQLAQVLAALASLAASEVVITAPSHFGFGAAGGTGWGTIGTGRYGTLGHGSGTGYGIGGSRSKAPTVQIGQPNANGDLDKAIIRRYIKRNFAKITYCYEKQLLASPGVAGKITVEFTIEPSGKVSASTASGFDAEVGRCVAGVIEDIEFPKPKSGGTVHVVYPFQFRPDGG